MKRLGKALLVLVLCILLAAGYLGLRHQDLLLDWRDSGEYPAEQLIGDRLTQQAERIYLYSYDLSPNALFSLWDQVYNNHPELFYVSPSYEYSLLRDRVFYVAPQYLAGEQTTADAKAQYQNALQNAVSGVEDGWSDLEKALYLHDWVALHAAYDESLEHRTAYDLLVQGTGVCQAYAQAYLALLQQCGIPCRSVTSEEMNHAWVILELDGAWYNVDVTHDDPTFDRLGHVQHGCFLKSNDALRESHFGGSGTDVCTSTAYDNAPWNTVSSAFVPVDGRFYCISGNRLCRWDDGGLTPLYTVSQRWYVSGERNSYWDGCFSALACDGDGLLLSTPDNILRYDPVTGEAAAVYSHTGPGDIYGFALQNGTAVLQIADSPNEAGAIITITLTEEDAP